MSDTDRNFWVEPFVGGMPARTWSVVAWVSVSVWTSAALVLVVLAFLGSPWTSSPLETVATVGFVVGAVCAFFGFPAMFRQANREIANGYCTVRGTWVRGSTPLVNPRTRRIEGGSTDRFDATEARARAPWASPTDRAPQPPGTPLPFTGPPFALARAISRNTLIVSTVLAGAAIWARSQDGNHTVLGTLSTGAIVIGGLLVVTLASAFIFASVQAKRLAKVSQMATGIIVACYITPQARASQDRLGLRKGAIPWVPVLVFDADGFSIWRAAGIPEPVLTISRRDVISLDVTRVFSGQVTTPGLQVDVIPPDERLPFTMEFTVFDPSRMLIAATEEKIGALVASVTELWAQHPNS